MKVEVHKDFKQSAEIFEKKFDALCIGVPENMTVKEWQEKRAELVNIFRSHLNMLVEDPSVVKLDKRQATILYNLLVGPGYLLREVQAISSLRTETECPIKSLKNAIDRSNND